MALATNTGLQLAKKLNANLGLRFGGQGYSAALSNCADGAPAIVLTNSSSVIVAVVALEQRTYAGFNVVAELSSSAAAGLPEYIAYCAISSSLSQVLTAQISMEVKALGTSSMKQLFPASPTLVNVIDETQVVAEFANDAVLGAVGN